MLIGVFLCMYFTFHSFHGSRSYPKLVSLSSSYEQAHKELAMLEQERSGLEKQVKQLRPGSIDTDMLEERARIVLGYKSPQEFVLLHP